MSGRTEHLNGVLCFCNDSRDGHQLGDACAVVIKPGNYPSRSAPGYGSPPARPRTEGSRAALDILRELAKHASTPELRQSARRSSAIAQAALSEWKRQGWR